MSDTEIADTYLLALSNEKYDVAFRMSLNTLSKRWHEEPGSCDKKDARKLWLRRALITAYYSVAEGDRKT